MKHCYLQVNVSVSILLAVQNERDKITRKPTEESERVLSPNILVSAEILSRPAHSPSGEKEQHFFQSLW